MTGALSVLVHRYKQQIKRDLIIDSQIQRIYRHLTYLVPLLNILPSRITYAYVFCRLRFDRKRKHNVINHRTI